MADIDRVVYESLRGCGVSDADRLTRAVTDGLRRYYAGCPVYVDKGFDARNAAIRSALKTGASPKQVAMQYRITTRRIYQIIESQVG